MPKHSPNDLSIDVAVIGSGFAGLSAAVEAANAGNKVTVFEKMPTAGGNSIYNAGQVAAVGTWQQEKAGIEDSVELMMKDMLAAGLDLNHKNLLETMIRTSQDTVKWTVSELGVEYRERVTQLGGHSVPRTLSTVHASGRDIIDPLLARVNAHPNIVLALESKLEGVLVDETTKSVRGVKIARDDRLMNVECSKGVVLAAGGFSADVEFRSIQNPSFDANVMSTNQPGATAEVIKEALKIGAMSVQLSRIQLGPWTSPDESGFGKGPFFCIGAGFPYGIIVDPDTSKRFVNEMGNRYERSMAIIKMGHPVVCITDAEGARHSLEKDFDKLKPTVREHATVDEVAKAYGMNPSVLQAEIDDYNEGVAKKADRFGKSLRDDLGPIAVAPFYSVRLWPKVHHCMGGLRINSNAQIMHIDGHPIGGLYGAGEVTGGVHGADRLGSCATTDCLCFGRIAGKSVARGGKTFGQ